MMYWMATAWAAFPMMAPIRSMMMAPMKNHQNADREARPLKVTMFLKPSEIASPKPTGPPCR